MRVHIPKDLKKKQIVNSEGIYLIMKKIYKRKSSITKDKEHFWIVGLKENNVLSNIELIAIGDDTSVNIDSVFIFKIALLKGSEKIILVHNHIGNNFIPSRKDELTTRHLVVMGNIVGLPVIDHIVFTQDNYFSFQEHNLIQSIFDDLYERSKNEDFIEQEAKLVHQRFGYKLETYRIVKNMIREGAPTQFILKVTGLGKNEIRALKEGEILMNNKLDTGIKDDQESR